MTTKEEFLAWAKDSGLLMEADGKDGRVYIPPNFAADAARCWADDYNADSENKEG